MAGKSRSWTPERKAKQAQWMRDNKPWEHSTGPRTEAGKATVKDNALRHGYRSADYRALLALLREQARFVKALRNKWLKNGCVKNGCVKNGAVKNG